MKSVMLSIKPKYCELIASEKKTLEIRKTRPKLDTPFKVYMYCTQDNKHNPDNNFWIMDKTGFNWIGNGKVIGEFVCDYIVDWDITYDKHSRVPHSFVIDGCLSPLELCEYAYKGIKQLRGWHISDLVIYDKPRELSEYGLARPPQIWCYVEEV